MNIKDAIKELINRKVELCIGRKRFYTSGEGNSKEYRMIQFNDKCDIHFDDERHWATLDEFVDYIAENL